MEYSIIKNYNFILLFVNEADLTSKFMRQPAGKVYILDLITARNHESTMVSFRNANLYAAVMTFRKALSQLYHGAMLPFRLAPVDWGHYSQISRNVQQVFEGVAFARALAGEYNESYRLDQPW